ncbi:MAG: cytochrome c oxidase assembly protein [Polaromonas sp.]
MQIKHENIRMVRKLGVIVLGMFCFGYALVPIYRAICEMTGINVLALGDRQIPGATPKMPANTQVDLTRTITVEFDANSRGPWHFKPAKSTLQVHPGEMTTVMYEFQNVQNRTMSAQAIPSYAPAQAGPHFNKLECFCFSQYTLAPGEKKEWPVVFVIDPKLSKDVSTITLSYTFFEVGGRTPPAPQASGAAVLDVARGTVVPSAPGV